MPRLSVVIATWNRGEKLVRTLLSLVAQTLPAAGWEAVVVNNNSTDDTPAVFARIAASHPGLNMRMVDEPQQGLSWARNRGIAEARGEIVVMIDDDEEVNPGFLAAYDSFFRSHPHADAAGGRMVACYEGERPGWMSHYTEMLAASTIDLGDRVIRFPRGRYPIGGNMAFRREVFDRYGVFRTELGRAGQSLVGGEEKELFMRIAAGGGQIWWVPDAVVDHIIPPSRVTGAHFRHLSRMVGVTARILARSRSRGSYVLAVAAESCKWVATLALALGYVLCGSPSKALYLIIMRRNISAGLLGRNGGGELF